MVDESMETGGSPSVARVNSSIRTGCDNLLKDDKGNAEAITFEFRKLEEKYNRSLHSGSTQNQPGLEEQYGEIPEASDLLDDASAQAIAQQEVAKLEGSQSGVSFLGM
jgi:hypothetical protein